MRDNELMINQEVQNFNQAPNSRPSHCLSGWNFLGLWIPPAFRN